MPVICSPSMSTAAQYFCVEHDTPLKAEPSPVLPQCSALVHGVCSAMTQSDWGPVGALETRVSPPASTATHRLKLGHDTLSSATFSRPAVKPVQMALSGLVECRIPPSASTATHKVDADTTHETL